MSDWAEIFLLWKSPTTYFDEYGWWYLAQSLNWNQWEKLLYFEFQHAGEHFPQQSAKWELLMKKNWGWAEPQSGSNILRKTIMIVTTLFLFWFFLYFLGFFGVHSKSQKQAHMCHKLRHLLWRQAMIKIFHKPTNQGNHQSLILLSHLRLRKILETIHGYMGARAIGQTTNLYEEEETKASCLGLSVGWRCVCPP